MIQIVVKRDGAHEDYSIDKILTAIRGAYEDEQKVLSNETSNNIREKIEIWESTQPDEVSVEDIQDFVEGLLCGIDTDIARHYIKYRAEHKRIRDFVTNKRNYINNFIQSNNTANATIDDNSNVGTHNIANLNAEIHKEDNIQINRGMVMSKLKELYPNFDEKQYIKDLEHHIIYKHDESSFAGAIAPYCVSVSLYPFLLNGIKDLGGLSAAPKNLDSYCGMLCNLIFAVSAQFAGAVAVSEALLYFTYFCKKEWGDDFYLHPDTVISQNCSKEKTIRSQIHQHWQQIIYTISQPASARSYQSCFTNFSYFDKPFFEGMFGNFCFPDCSKPDWESLCWIQKEFMRWFNDERLKTILTFPVESVTLLYKDGKFVDEDMYNFVCEEYARGHSFFTYISDSVDSLSSCCFNGNEIIEFEKDGIKSETTIKDFIEKYGDGKYEGYIDDNIYINSFDKDGNLKGKTRIVSYLNKSYSDYLYEFNVGDHSIKVTPDHLILVQDIQTGEIMTIPAQYLYNNIDKYLIATNNI